MYKIFKPEKTVDLFLFKRTGGVNSVWIAGSNSTWPVTRKPNPASRNIPSDDRRTSFVPFRHETRAFRAREPVDVFRIRENRT